MSQPQPPSAVLVVGGGFIGSHVARGFVARGIPTTVLTRSKPEVGTLARLNGARVMISDATNAALIRDALDGTDHVVWCAGGLLPTESTHRPIDDVLATLPPLLVVLEELAQRGGMRIAIVSSGGTVYGNPAVLPVPEIALPRPLSSHGVTRLASEHYVDLYAQLHGVRGVALRCANVYGEGQRSDRSQGVVAATMAHIQRGEPVPMFGDGSTTRDYVHVDDVVHVVCDLLDRPDLPSVINLGSGVGTPLRELLELIGAVAGRAFEVEPLAARQGDVRSIVLDIDLLQSLVHFEPTTLRDGIERTWATFEHAGGT